MIWGRVTGILAVAHFVTLAGCVSMPGQEPMPQQARYVCENGKGFAVEFLAEPSAARVGFDGREITLPQTIGATDAKYTDGQNTLYIEENRALLEMAGQVFGRGCVRQ
ncbi:MAG TPA: MliC family protein [Candidatus Methylomirabilis sp.]|nr:MliC family protein [Candidatus Methylomirabilis sp.]